MRIGNIYEEDQLEELSDIIKGKSDCISDHVYISYLQPGMDAAAGAWAVAEYNPDFVLRIFGKVKKNFASLKSYAVDSLNTYLGHWIDLSSQDDLVYRIKRTTNGFSLELYSPSERSNSELCPLRKTNRNGEQIFIDMGDPSQYYKINAKGNLEAFDNQGWIVTYQKIK